MAYHLLFPHYTLLYLQKVALCMMAKWFYAQSHWRHQYTSCTQLLFKKTLFTIKQQSGKARINECCIPKTKQNWRGKSDSLITLLTTHTIIATNSHQQSLSIVISERGLYLLWKISSLH